MGLPRPARSIALARIETLAAAWIVLAAGLAAGQAVAQAADIAVAPQYGTTHVYMAPADMSAFAAAFTATFGGAASTPAVIHVTPTASSARWQAIQTPEGTISLFGFMTPIPYPFGAERTGYLVRDMDAAIAAARAAGADVLVAPFPDPIGRDAVVQWPGGVNMQLYVHNTPPAYPAFRTIPENRVYVSPERADAFVRAFLAFSHGAVTGDDPHAPGVGIGRPGAEFREIRLDSAFGKLTVLVTDGHLPFPYGRETTGYEVADLTKTLARATGAGASVLAGPYSARDRNAAVVQFPGGYIAEIHAPAGP
jgi:predicted enzyme related to lactoylglutathione lyase